MLNATELRGLLDSIIKGVKRQTTDLSQEEFVDLYDQLLKRVDQSKTDVTAVLADGQAWVSFPKLSRQIVKVAGRRPLSRKDLRLTSPGNVIVLGGDHRSFRVFLAEDLRDAWFIPVIAAVVIGLISQVMDVGQLASAFAPLLALAASIFFAVFVLFGVGEVVRAVSLQDKMFRSGQLQHYLDADRYLVRLAVVSFTLSLSATIAEPVRAGFLKVIATPSAPSWAGPVSFLVVAAVLWASLVSTLLCLRAASGYLLERAAGSVLLGLGEETIESAHAEIDKATETAGPDASGRTLTTADPRNGS